MDGSTEAAFPALPPDSWRENVAAVVLDAGGRVLLGLGTGRNAYWHFPQGGVGSKETLEAALQRELREEAGLEPECYSILARYGGLRYRYRKGNEKSGRWRGQEQTYFLILCHAEMPATDYSRTDEFSALTWVPWRELSTELFAPVKRKVVEKILAIFFPPHLGEGELLPHIRTTLTPLRYRLAGRSLADCPADERALYGGGKEEMSSTLARLAFSLKAAHKSLVAEGGKLLVILHGAEGSGRKQSLRRLAANLDSLHLLAAEVDIVAPGFPWELSAALPPAGSLSLIILRGDAFPSPQDWCMIEQWLTGQGVRLLKLYLHTAAAAKGDLMAATDTHGSPWYIIPSARRWYRDFLVATLVTDALTGTPKAPYLS